MFWGDGLRFGVLGFGFPVSGLGFRIEDLGDLGLGATSRTAFCIGNTPKVSSSFKSFFFFLRQKFLLLSEVSSSFSRHRSSKALQPSVESSKSLSALNAKVSSWLALGGFVK